MHIRCGKRQRSHFLFSLYLLATLVFFIPFLAHAQMSEVSKEELSEISAQSGITYVIGDSRFRIETDSYRFSDTDSTKHWIELNNVTVDDGSGGYFSMDTPETFEDFNTVDVATNSLGLTAVLLNLSTHVQPRTYTVGNFVFCDQDIGSLQLENLRTGASDRLIFGARNDGSTGISLEYHTELMLDSIKYTYDSPTLTPPSSLTLGGIHLARFAYGDPATPTSWTFGGKFFVGDFDDNTPMTVDVATITYEDSTSAASVIYNIPMKGSIRVQDVSFGGNIYGPCAIDGINVHRLVIQVPGK